MRIGVPRELRNGETRVALTPESVKRLIALARPKDADPGAPSPLQIDVEPGAGDRASFDDAQYQDAGARIADGAEAVWRESDLVVCVNPPAPAQASLMREGAALLGSLRSTGEPELIETLRSRRISAMAFEAIPRITRAQKVDVLSSMATIAGYRAVLHGALACPKIFPMLMTAAGTVTASRVLILGAGVAGLQAIATAKRLGAVVEAYDVRAAAAEQVESLGARFLRLEDPGAETDAETAGGYARELTPEEQAAQRERLARHIAQADVVITTAQVPGRAAPRLIDRATTERMRPGAVIVDMAAESGGNCELTRAGERVEHNGVVILGPVNLPAETPVHASIMHSRNAAAFIADMIKDGELRIDMEDEVVRGAMITHDGEIVHNPTREAMGLPKWEKESTA
ncbi:MAG: Re/Si-specific NAD(P)(+) transhydrogenase subunit alpha [Phycisphaeraceae bacterium]|nr:MAG: Re/Si-specific NAD(P)(+) transhydrogenase subunit alpha [Phycisphaeraceae bacterium]